MSADCSRKPELLLAMGGTEERLQLVLGKPGPDGYGLLASRQWTVPGESIKHLVPGLKEMLDGLDLTTKDIEKVACVHGPGSFTGMRLALAAAEGVAAGHSLPMAGLDYLRLLASGPASLLAGPLHVLTYARRGLVYLHSFAAPDLTEIEPLAAWTLTEAAARIAAHSPEAHLMGSGLRKNPEFFSDLAKANPGYTLLDAHWDNPAPEVLLAVAADADYSVDSIEPVYVRPTDAEDNLPNIAKKRGIDPDKARQRLKELQQS